EDVAGHELALDLHLLAALHFGDGFGRNLDRLDELLEAQALGLGKDGIADLVLEAGIGVDDVPAGHCGLSLRLRRATATSARRRRTASPHPGRTPPGAPSSTQRRWPW